VLEDDLAMGISPENLVRAIQSSLQRQHSMQHVTLPQKSLRNCAPKNRRGKRGQAGREKQPELRIQPPTPR